MLYLEDISKAYGDEQLFKDCSLKINTGEHIALVGRNGSGKSTLFRLIIGEETLDGGNINTPRDYTFGYLKQYLDFKLPTIKEEVTSCLPKGKKDDLYLADKILCGLGFTVEDLSRPAHEFSGGFQLRVHLAQVLISEPSCLLLDEPTNYLDIIAIRWLKQLLRQWPGELVMISHDRDFLTSTCTHTVGIHRSKFRKVQGGPEDYYKQICQDEEVYEKTRTKIEKKKSDVETFIKRFGAKAAKATQAQSKAKILDKLPIMEQLRQLQNLDFSFPYASLGSKRLIEAHQISFAYPGQESLIENLNLDIDKNDRIAIVGKNGRGKSTILKLLAGIEAPVKGTLNSKDKVEIAYFGQSNIERLHKNLSIEDEILSANPYLKYSDVRGICGLMMFSGDKAKKTIDVLSGGEKSRVLLGKLLAKPSNVLLLDEPTNHLDMESVEALLEAVINYPGAVVLVTHSEGILKSLKLDKLLVCRESSQQLFLGDYELFLSEGGWEEELQSTKSSSKPKKERRKQRAELLSEKSSVLKPYKQKISVLEQNITKTEGTLAERESRLVEIASSTNSKEITALSKEIGELRKELDQFYESYTSIQNEHDTLVKAFDERLQGLD